MYSKEELLDLIINNPEEYKTYKSGETEELDLSELDF